LRHVERRHQTRAPRRGAGQTAKKLRLESRCRAQPDLRKQDVTRREPVVDRPGGRAHRPGDSTDRRGSGTAGRDEAARRHHDLICVVLRRPRHDIRILVLNGRVNVHGKRPQTRCRMPSPPFADRPYDPRDWTRVLFGIGGGCYLQTLAGITPYGIRKQQMPSLFKSHTDVSPAPARPHHSQLMKVPRMSGRLLLRPPDHGD
jgi:hypothetical protein